ncbi:hypothetical protein Nepgr_017980 [Nepenthes gracilis]|uniref:Uncharacterized protein n=1 Tax=Nepenthes gracilis TaxID=150966 RepID=A0AAD3XTM4_NEPGR|nr:hypothetical protein Nepgr_017980 [Nepenthes gracilis]
MGPSGLSTPLALDVPRLTGDVPRLAHADQLDDLGGLVEADSGLSVRAQNSPKIVYWAGSEQSCSFGAIDAVNKAPVGLPASLAPEVPVGNPSCASCNYWRQWHVSAIVKMLKLQKGMNLLGYGILMAAIEQAAALLMTRCYKCSMTRFEGRMLKVVGTCVCWFSDGGLMMLPGSSKSLLLFWGCRAYGAAVMKMLKHSIKLVLPSLLSLYSAAADLCLDLSGVIPPGFWNCFCRFCCGSNDVVELFIALRLVSELRVIQLPLDIYAGVGAGAGAFAIA